MGALGGLKVLDLSVLVQGPQAAAMLHDLGADVVKIELPGQGDLARWLVCEPGQTDSGFFEGCNRGKRSCTLDLRQPGGKRALEALASRADVLIHNFVPGTMEAWGLDYEHLSARNPRLVYATGSTYGPLGAAAGREGADTSGQAAGGLIATTGRAGGEPTTIGAVIADHTGCQNMVTGILAALYHRERTGRGQRVDVSLVGGMVWAQCSEFSHFLITGADQRPADRGHPLLPTLLRLVPTADGWLVLVGVPAPLWPAFARAIDRPELADEARFHTLLPDAETLAEMRALVDEVFPTRTTAEWCERLAAAGQRFAPVRGYADIAADPDAFENGYLVRVEHPTRGDTVVVGNPVRLSETPTVPGVVTPELGQHTEEVLLEAGFGWDDIESLRADGAF